MFCKSNVFVFSSSKLTSNHKFNFHNFSFCELLAVELQSFTRLLYMLIIIMYTTTPHQQIINNDFYLMIK